MGQRNVVMKRKSPITLLIIQCQVTGWNEIYDEVDRKI